ncbi:arginine deiminase-related protein [bacterium]|nr:arginine deiminase-related protein [bacterium]
MSDEKVDHKKANAQWETLVHTIKESGALVKTIEPISGLPDMVFTANCGFALNGTFIISSMKYKERQQESTHFRRWFEKQSYQIVDLIPGVSYEGRGDTLLHGNTIIGGYGYRTDLLSLEITAGSLGMNLISLKLKDPRFYHLDTCFCKVSSTAAIYYPEAFKEGEIKKLSGIIDLIPIEESDARLFMCNSMLVNDTLLIPSRDSKIEKILKNDLGIKTAVVDVSEFLKSGGSIQCLCLKI